MSEYQLSWSLFHNNLCNGLSQLQHKEEFVDMTLAADGHLVKVHRNIMSVASPYIKEMLQSTSCRDPIVFLNNVSYHNLSYILEYIYTGEVKVPKHALASFIKAGKALHITGVKDLILPMLPQEFNQSSAEHGQHSTKRIVSSTYSLAESVTNKNQFSTNSKAATELNTTELEINQPVEKDKIESNNNTDLQAHSHTNIDTDVNSQNSNADVECMDIDFIGPQVSNNQANKEKSILEKALENIDCADSYETSQFGQYQSDVTFNVGEVVGAIPLNNDKSTAPKFSLEIKSFERHNGTDPPALCINIRNDTHVPDSTSVVVAPNPDAAETHDASEPLYSVSERGYLQLILNRFIYNVHHSSFGNRKRRWRCKDYRKLNCKAYIDTMCDKITERHNEHTHGFHDDKILKKGSAQNIYATTAGAEAALSTNT